MTLPNKDYCFEICVETPTALMAAIGISDRIELCSGLDVGGLTPDIGMMQLATEIGVETHVLIRPHCGDFTMDAGDLTVALSSIRMVRQLGLKGVVIGAERDGVLDRQAMEAMVNAAQGLDVTLHRVIDILDDPIAALECAIELNISRILTSGGAPKAIDGAQGLCQLHEAANGRIEIMAGSGINSQILPDLLATTPVTSFHASCSKKVPIDKRYPNFGFGAA